MIEPYWTLKTLDHASLLRQESVESNKWNGETGWGKMRQTSTQQMQKSEADNS